MKDKVTLNATIGKKFKNVHKNVPKSWLDQFKDHFAAVKTENHTKYVRVYNSGDEHIFTYVVDDLLDEGEVHTNMTSQELNL